MISLQQLLGTTLPAINLPSSVGSVNNQSTVSVVNPAENNSPSVTESDLMNNPMLLISMLLAALLGPLSNAQASPEASTGSLADVPQSASATTASPLDQALYGSGSSVTPSFIQSSAASYAASSGETAAVKADDSTNDESETTTLTEEPSKSVQETRHRWRDNRTGGEGHGKCPHHNQGSNSSQSTTQSKAEQSVGTTPTPAILAANPGDNTMLIDTSRNSFVNANGGNNNSGKTTQTANMGGQVTLSRNFQDKVLPNRPYDSAFVAKTKPQILTENGNSFLRITGAYGDNSNVTPDAAHAKRVRSTLFMTETSTKMPVLTDDNKTQYYSADIRFNDNLDPSTVVDNNFMELYQYADSESETYGAKNGIGPTARFSRESNGHVYFENNYANETKQKKVDLGYYAPGEFNNFGLKAVWSNDPNEALFEVYVNGELKQTLTGLPSNLGPNSNRLPGLKFGLYGDNAVGSIDLDNVEVKQL